MGLVRYGMRFIRITFSLDWNDLGFEHYVRRASGNNRRFFAGRIPPRQRSISFLVLKQTVAWETHCKIRTRCCAGKEGVSHGSLQQFND